MKTISVVTITQESRQKCIMNLCDFIEKQTYRNKITEWVIVEGSKTKEEANRNKEFIKNKLFRITDIPITYVEQPEGEGEKLKLSDFRNIGNEVSQGDIIICMDDDDYYPPMRIEDAVLKLTSTKKQIAGCSSVYLYDYKFEKLYKFKRFSYNHSTNNCLAYKKEYLLNHRYAEGLSSGEEMSFTDSFSEPMIQLDANKCIVVSSHNSNTFDKSCLCVKENKQIDEIEDMRENEEIIPFEIKNKIKESLN